MTHDPSTATATDEQMKHAVIAGLESVLGAESVHVGVSVDTATVTLSGRLHTTRDRDLAGNLALGVGGVIAVAQDITLDSLFVPATDSDIALDAGQALDHAENVPGSVRVSVNDHLITLTGDASYADQSAAAGRAMHHVVGATGVINKIRVCDDGGAVPTDSLTPTFTTPTRFTTPTKEGMIMSPYENRLTLVEHALKAEKVHPGKGRTLAEAAVTVLAAIDHIKENVR